MFAHTWAYLCALLSTTDQMTSNNSRVVHVLYGNSINMFYCCNNKFQYELEEHFVIKSRIFLTKTQNEDNFFPIWTYKFSVSYAWFEFHYQISKALKYHPHVVLNVSRKNCVHWILMIEYWSKLTHKKKEMENLEELNE